jgi:hypothetical protein
MMVVPVKVYDSIVAGSDNLEVDAIQLLNTAILTPAVAGTLDVNAKQFGGATVNATTSVTIPTSATLATTGGAVGSVTGAVGSVTGSVASVTGAVGSVTGAVGSVTGAVGSVTGNVDGNVTGSVASVVGAVGSVTGLTAANLDTTISSRASQTSLDTLDDLVDTEVGAIKTKTDQLTFTVANQIDANSLTIGANAITASALATDAVNEIVDQVWDELLSGHTGAGSTGAGLSAAGAAGDPWSTALPGSYGAGTAGKIVGDNVNATISSRASQTSLDTLDDYVDTEVGAIKTKTDQLVFTVANQVDSNSLTNGGLSASATRSAIGLATANLDTQIGTLATPTNITAATGITVSSIGADVVTASALAASAVNEIADQVWDELLSGHTTGGSTGAGLTSASSAGDPWSTVIPASYGAGTAGKILGDNVNATISSRASQTSLDTLDDLVDTEVAAIKTKTDQLTFTVANQVDSNSLSVSATGIRTAVGLATANLDTQIAAVPTAAQNFAAVLTTALTESYAADNTAPTLAQAIMLIQQSLHEFAINSTTRTVKKLDGSTTAATFTLDSATAPTSTTRAT